MFNHSGAVRHSFLHEAARHGLKWRNHMQDIVDSNVNDVLNGYDIFTGLRLFMLAAMGNNLSSDLSSIYGMMRMSPEICDK